MSKTALLSAETAAAIFLPEQTQYAPDGIVSRTLVQTPSLRVILFAFAAGQELTEHASNRRVTVQILSGECDFHYAGEWHRMKAGEFLHLPPGHVHSVKAPGDFSMILALFAEPAAGAA